MQALEAAAEVFSTVLLPDRKLRAWGERDLSQLSAGRPGQRSALFWAYEDALKDRHAPAGGTRARSWETESRVRQAVASPAWYWGLNTG